MIPVLPKTEFELFSVLLKKTTGITIPEAKRQSFGRKLAMRLEACNMTSYTSYYRMLKSEKGADELRALINQVTIGQTSFFRGGRQFSLLSREIVPWIVRKNSDKKRIRIWSAGCSRGHEPYSLAMMLQEAAKETITWDTKILATDIDSDSLKHAYKGRYKEDDLSQVPDDYVEKYFRRDRKSIDNVFVAKERLKKKLIFRRLNLQEFPYPVTGPVDMIFCRNVMIYFSTFAKKQIMAEFLRLLPEGGFLCLGASESLLGIDDRFSLIGHAVYKKGP